MEKIPEWNLIQELIEFIDEFHNENQQLFIQELFDLLDPNIPFLEQRSEGQLNYLHQLHELYVNGNEDAFEDDE